MELQVVQVPERFNAAAFLVERHVAEEQGSRTVFRYRGRRVTYWELAEPVTRLGRVFKKLEGQLPSEHRRRAQADHSQSPARLGRGDPLNREA